MCYIIELNYLLNQKLKILTSNLLTYSICFFSTDILSYFIIYLFLKNILTCFYRKSFRRNTFELKTKAKKS